MTSGVEQLFVLPQKIQSFIVVLALGQLCALATVCRVGVVLAAAGRLGLGRFLRGHGCQHSPQIDRGHRGAAMIVRKATRRDLITIRGSTNTVAQGRASSGARCWNCWPQATPTSVKPLPTRLIDVSACRAKRSLCRFYEATEGIRSVKLAIQTSGLTERDFLLGQTPYCPSIYRSVFGLEHNKTADWTSFCNKLTTTVWFTYDGQWPKIKIIFFNHMASLDHNKLTNQSMHNWVWYHVWSQWRPSCTLFSAIKSNIMDMCL